MHFEFRAWDGTLLGSVTNLITDSTPGARTLFAGLDVNLPTQPFRVYAVGKDARGNPFERVLSNLIVPDGGGERARKPGIAAGCRYDVCLRISSA